MSDPIELVKNTLVKLIGEPGTKQLNPGNLINRISSKSELNFLDVQQSLLFLSKEGYITGIGPRGVPNKKVGWTELSHHPVSESRKLITEVAENITSDDVTRDILIKNHKYFSGLSEEDVARFLEGLLALRGAEISDSNDRYILSARYLLGSSKALDNIARITKNLEITLPDDETTYYALTAGKADASQALFVENPRVFNYLKAFANRYNTLIISSYGFGLTFENFSNRLESNTIIACPTDGESQADMRTVLSKPSVLYWGDLDKAGLAIFESLQKCISHLSLSSIYTQMIDDVEQKGHPYHHLFEKGGQKDINYRLAMSSKIIGLCGERALDQELYCNDSYLSQIFAPLDITE